MAGSAADQLEGTNWDALLEQALASVGVRTVYQPIVDLRRRTVVGYEALTRFDGRPGIGPDRWFEAATERGLAAELDAVSLSSALARRPDLPPNCFLAVNVEPDSLLSPVVRRALRSGGPLAGVVVEITEHRRWDPVELEPALRSLRGEGALLAVDDAGAGYAGLQQILRLRPSVLKVDRAITDGVDVDEAKASLVEMLGVFASRIDAWLLVEGVETVAEALRLQAMGVPLAQGYLFGRPAAPWAPIDPVAHLALADGIDRPSTTLHQLVHVLGAIDVAEWVDDHLAGDGHAGRWQVVLDTHRRPLGLLDAQSPMAAELVPTVVANVSATPAEVAHRLATADHDPATPVLVVDNSGHYVGVVPIKRLLSHLASTSA